jgi:outer membrane cobalamin receptor
MDLEDFIERIGDEPFENREKLRMRGVEVTASTRPVEPLFLSMSYGYLDARDRGSDDFDELQSRPRHKLDFETRVFAPWGTTLRLAVSYLADTFVYTRNAPFEQKELDDFTIVDVRVSQRLLADRVELYAGVDDVFDDEWALNYGFPQPGRTFYGGVELSF